MFPVAPNTPPTSTGPYSIPNRALSALPPILAGMARGKPKFQKQRPPDESAVGTDWRLFIAIPIPDEARELLSRITASLATHDWPIRWVAADSAHLTLH